MKPVFLISALAGLISLSACAQKTEVTLSEPTDVKIHAIGVELDPHFYAQNVVGRNDASKPEDLDIITDRVTRMGIQRFRVMIQPQWFEPYNDNDDPQNTDMDAFKWNTVEMQSVYKVLDLAQQIDADVCLVVWGCPVHVSMVEKEYQDVRTCFMLDPDNIVNWVNPPKDPEEFAENFAALVYYLREVKGYDCVKEVTPFNEPDGNVCTLEPYYEICKAMDRQFKRLGVREDVLFQLSDNCDTRRFYLEGVIENIPEITDMTNSHTYLFGYATTNDEVQSWEKANVAAAKKAGKPHMVGEFGSSFCVGATRQTDIDLYLRGVLMIRHALNFFNAGACGISYWSLIDQYYNYNADLIQMQQLGMWRYLRDTYVNDPAYAHIADEITEDYQVRDQYYAYSLLTKYVRRGAEVYPIELGKDFANATAFLNEDGKWVYVIANQENEDLSLRIAGKAKGEFDVYRYKEDELPEGDALIEPYTSLTSKNGKVDIVAHANTVVLIRQK